MKRRGSSKCPKAYKTPRQARQAALARDEGESAMWCPVCKQYHLEPALGYKKAPGSQEGNRGL